MENSKFGGNKIQLSIPARLKLMNSNERVEVTLSSGEILSGLLGSYIDNKLELTLVGTDEKTNDQCRRYQQAGRSHR